MKETNSLAGACSDFNILVLGKHVSYELIKNRTSMHITHMIKSQSCPDFLLFKQNKIPMIFKTPELWFYLRIIKHNEAIKWDVQNDMINSNVSNIIENTSKIAFKAVHA